MDELIGQMWVLPARTANGRRAKFDVFLKCISRDVWRESDDDTDYDVRMVRSLLIEFIGGEPAEQLRRRFTGGVPKT